MPKSVRRPRVDLDARGRIATHGWQTPRRVVLHDTESHDAAGIRDLGGICGFWQRQGRGYGAHVIVDKDANSALCAEANQICWHVANRNTHAVGIEIVGFASFSPNFWFLRPRQLHKVARWLAFYNHQYGIPLVADPERGITTHRQQSKLYGGDHYDPGIFFPFNYVLKQAQVYRQEGWW